MRAANEWGARPRTVSEVGVGYRNGESPCGFRRTIPTPTAWPSDIVHQWSCYHPEVQKYARLRGSQTDPLLPNVSVNAYKYALTANLYLKLFRVGHVTSSLFACDWITGEARPSAYRSVIGSPIPRATGLDRPWCTEMFPGRQATSPPCPSRHHTLGIECKGALPTGVDRMLFGNRVVEGLTRSTISSFAPI